MFTHPRKKLNYICPIVSVGVCLKGYPDVSVSLHVVPTIFEPLTFQPVKASVRAYGHLTGLDLANATKNQEQLPSHILIGCDHYWDLVTRRICGGEKGPTAVHTKLGWVLSGATAYGHSITSFLACSITTHSLRVDCCPTSWERLEEHLQSF